MSVTTDGYGNGAATFDITNVGGRVSGTYYFTANLPTRSPYTYSSPAQASLSPGSHMQNTLRFSLADGGIFSVSITTSDANAGNNYASQPVNASYSPLVPSYGTQYNYGPYNYNTYPQYQNYQYSYPTSQYQYYSQQYPYSTYYPYAY